MNIKNGAREICTVHGVWRCVICFLLVAVSAVPAFSQANTFSFNFKNQELKTIFREIENATSYSFAYSDTEIDLNKRISFKIENADIATVMTTLAKQCSFSYEVAGAKIILTPVAPPELFWVSGIILDSETRQPLPGATIALQNKSLGTSTDAQGRFQLDIPIGKHQIQISSIGYKNQSLSIASDTVLNIFLVEDFEALAEVVVVAFGQEHADRLTGSVAVVNPSIYAQVNQASLNESLQSNSTGLLVRNNAGTPGSAINVNIRGISSITASNSPLYIVDGIPIITGNFSQLDFSGQTIDAISDIAINDIESITVLKDAAAASLFGSRASNGVILINTKRGRKNDQVFEFATYYGVQQSTGMLDMLNAQQWMTLQNEEAIAAGDDPLYTSEEIANNSTDTDWQREIFRTAPTYNAYFSVRGGKEKSAYYVGANYFNQEGIILGSEYERYSFRTNFDNELSDRLGLKTGASFSYSINDRIEGDQSLNGPLPNAISMPPIYPVYNSDGSFNNDGSFANPVSIAKEEKNTASAFRNLMNFSLEYDLHKHLSIKNQTGTDYYNLREQTYNPKSTRQGAKYNGLGIEATNNTVYLYNSTYAEYQLKRKNHCFNAIAGGSIEKYKQHDSYLRAQNFPSSDFQFLQDAATPIETNSYEEDVRMASLFSRIKYGYGDKYILTLNLRRDGSSRFGANNRYGNFPSVSAMWDISKEGFFNQNKSLNKLKLMASYGLTGNDRIGNFGALDLFAAGYNYNGQAGIAPSQLANPDLKWESTRELNLGLELEIFERIALKVEWYQKTTKDLLLEKPMPTSTGYQYVLGNIGKIENRGIETQLNAQILKGDFKWNLSLNISANQNKVLELYDGQPIRNIGRASSSIEVGQPVSFFYGFRSLGVDPENGLLIYEDLNGDGEINNLDQTRIGSPHPDFYGGIGSSFSYRDFRLNVLFSFSSGNDIFNATRRYTETLSMDNQTTAVLNRWQQPGDVTDVPRASSYNERISSRWVENGSFLRLKNVKLSYNLNEEVLRKSPFTQVEIYLAGKNLITWTNYSGIDPEVNYNASNTIVLGTDFFTCPQAKTLLIGLCARF